MKKLRVAILGTGHIGNDLLYRVMASPYLECRMFAGRNEQSPSIINARKMEVLVSTKGIDGLSSIGSELDLVFDATSAACHLKHAAILKDQHIQVIDLTPARIGKMCIPAINLESCVNEDNINLATCGGQAAIPIAYAIAQVNKKIVSIETVTTASALVAGPATIENLDEYLYTTAQGLGLFGESNVSRAILAIHPGEICMQTTVLARMKEIDLTAIRSHIYNMVESVQQYSYGYELACDPVVENDRLVVIVRIKAISKNLPSYAGNVDIIDSAAIKVAEAIFIKKNQHNGKDTNSRYNIT